MSPHAASQLPSQSRTGGSTQGTAGLAERSPYGSRAARRRTGRVRRACDDYPKAATAHSGAWTAVKPWTAMVPSSGVSGLGR
uniref:Uncharacterized protein n=1 Tax=Oryza sativa subsp. japonica TaxID=39947 RepID=Q5VQD2_ORYSJ|nr:hypothetical protein [Oryza sativa Japonica Group]